MNSAHKKIHKKTHTLCLEKLSVSVREKRIVSNVSLIVKSGEIHVLMGPNGSGKSTLLHALMGNPAYQIRSGSVELDSTDLTHLSPDARAKKGLFLGFQYPVDIPGLSLGSMLRTAKNAREKNAHPHAPVRTPAEFTRELKAVIALLGMKENLYSHAVNEGYSGGEKKKSEIVQMLALQPTFALLDEIDSGLDVDALRTIAQAIQRAVQNGMGVILVTHYARILQYLQPHRVHVFMRGTIATSGGMELANGIEAQGYGAYL